MTQTTQTQPPSTTEPAVRREATGVATPVTRSGGQRIANAWERLGPVFETIAAGAAARETERRLDLAAVHALRDAGFTRLRLPEEHGGAGLSFTEATDFLVALAAADSNLAQALRAHWLHVEDVLSSTDPQYRRRWLARLGDGAVVGNALTERGNQLGELTTRLQERGNGTLVLDGTKFYSTGALYADWILASAVDDDGNEVGLAVRADAPGITREDDWDGFGQQLTASGTTEFDDTPVDRQEVSAPGAGLDNGARVAAGQASAQYVHLATLTGIGQALVRDAAEYVRGRQRSFSHAAAELPRDDAQVLQVIGEVSAAVYAAESALAGVLPRLQTALARDAADEIADERETNELYIRVYQAQQVVAKNVLWAATQMFEVGGASATSESRLFDRHWRNARVLASHNPLIYRARIIGDWEVNRIPPSRSYRIGSV